MVDVLITISEATVDNVVGADVYYVIDFDLLESERCPWCSEKLGHDWYCSECDIDWYDPPEDDELYDRMKSELRDLRSRKLEE